MKENQGPKTFSVKHTLHCSVVRSFDKEYNYDVIFYAIMAICGDIGVNIPNAYKSPPSLSLALFQQWILQSRIDQYQK